MSKKLFIILVSSVVVVITLLLIGRAANNETLDAFNKISSELEWANFESQEEYEELDYYKDSYLKTGFSSFEESAEQLDTFLEELKDQLRDQLIEYDPSENDGVQLTDHVLFDGRTPSQRGLELVSEISGFRATFYEDFNELYPDLVTECEERFNTAPETGRDGSEVSWLEYHFKGFPSIAVMTKLSQFQADIQYLREELIFREE